MTKADTIKAFTKIKGLGEAKATQLYDAGYHSLQDLQKATVKDLTAIKGFSETNAQAILDHLKELGEMQPSQKTKKAGKQIEKPAKKEEKLADENVQIVEETTEKAYSVKKKPELSKKTQKQMHIRKKIKQRTPTFLREEWFRYKRIPKNWRRPDGITSKMRKNLKYRPSKVRVGFRGPQETRGLHPSGFEEILIHTVRELDNIDPKHQAVRIGGTVGMKKRLQIAEKAKELDIRVLNMKV